LHGSFEEFREPQMELLPGRLRLKTLRWFGVIGFGRLLSQ
jgi:hypothetical protein